MPMSPLSTSDLKLAEVRARVKELNLQLFTLLKERRTLVNEVQALKALGQKGCFDPAREWQLFQELLPELRTLSIREVLAFSLVMEAHAGAPLLYPAWSNAVHLLEAPSHDEHRMNPLLLKCLSPKAFDGLALTSEFSFLRSI